MKKRNGDVIKHLRGEINLGTRKIRDKKKYNRKNKHKNVDNYQRVL